MNDDNIIQKAPTNNSSEPIDDDSANSVRVFDISEDSISPVNDEPQFFAPKKQVTPSIQSSQQPNTQNAKPYISPDKDMLDKKIGTFDTTPFAPKPAPTFVNVKKPEPLLNTQPRTSTPPTNLPTGQTSPRQPITLVPKKPSPIPLQDISIPVLHPIPKQQGPITQKAPTPTQTVPASAPTQAPISTSTSTPATPSKEETSSGIVKPIRTYEGDVAEAMSHRRTSTASIAIAESKKMEGEEKISNNKTTTPSNHSGIKFTMILLSILLLGGGAIGAYYLYSISPLAPVTPTTSQKKTTPSIIPSNLQAVIVVDGQDSITIQKRIQAEVLKNQTPNTIKEIVIAKKNTSGSLNRVGGPSMIRELDINVPDILTRSLTSNWMLGVHSDAESKNTVFVVATSNFFQNTFAGMLQWESVMADDLKRYLFPIEPEGISNSSSQQDSGIYQYTNPLDNIDSILPATASSSSATSTQIAKTSTSTAKSTIKIATTTKNDSLISTTTSTTTEIVQPLRTYLTIRGKFEDKIVKNKDVREFRTDTGEILFLYSFIDSSHLVITSSEEALAEILTRLEKQSFIR